MRCEQCLGEECIVDSGIVGVAWVQTTRDVGHESGCSSCKRLADRAHPGQKDDFDLAVEHVQPQLERNTQHSGPGIRRYREQSHLHSVVDSGDVRRHVETVVSQRVRKRQLCLAWSSSKHVFDTGLAHGRECRAQLCTKGTGFRPTGEGQVVEGTCGDGTKDRPSSELV